MVLVSCFLSDFQSRQEPLQGDRLLRHKCLPQACSACHQDSAQCTGPSLHSHTAHGLQRTPGKRQLQTLHLLFRMLRGVGRYRAHKCIPPAREEYVKRTDIVDGVVRCPSLTKHRRAKLMIRRGGRYSGGGGERGTCACPATEATRGSPPYGTCDCQSGPHWGLGGSMRDSHTEFAWDARDLTRQQRPIRRKAHVRGTMVYVCGVQWGM